MGNATSFDHAGFSPLPAIIGGLCLGLFSSSKLYLTGRPLGISSILRSALQKKRKEVSLLDWGVNLSFVLGFIAAALVAAIFHPHLLQPFPKNPTATPSWGGSVLWYLRILGGGIVTGVGTTMSSGCTSGHGITGLSRFSLRSLVATCCFMTTAILAGTAMNVSRDFPKPEEGVAIANPEASGSAYIALIVAAAVLLAASLPPLVLGDVDSYRVRAVRVYVVVFTCAFGFGSGLIVGGMALPSKMAAFLDLRAWDPTLPFIMLGAHLVQTPAVQLAIEAAMASQRPPPLGLLDAQGKHADCASGNCGWSLKGVDTSRVDRRLVTGAGVFGVGWALSGTCPGPSMLMLGAHEGQWPAGHSLGLTLGWCAAFALGSYAATHILPPAPAKTAPSPPQGEGEEAGPVHELRVDVPVPANDKPEPCSIGEHPPSSTAQSDGGERMLGAEAAAAYEESRPRPET